ncbi:MerR family transcriptional regulator [Georgenia sp. 311]|uniref:MerR family transcriptional regulator n=1 Tax=Georgenia sp. 311 TaxID=2585134 RepID=UPI0021004AA5|nr:MerR family transcriptional regulator [Georgenia sp. 311]
MSRGIPEMKIGELAERTGVAPRLLRYYEQQGLIAAGRASNGYRTYSQDDVERVQRVAGLVRSGVPTRLVRAILDLEGIEAPERAATCSRGVAEQLAAELADLEDRIACLTRSRDTIRRFLEQTEHGAVLAS